MRVWGVDREGSVGLGAFSRSYGSLLAGGSGRRREERLAELDWADSWAWEDAAACVLSGSNRRLFADVFGLVRFAAGRAGVGACEDKAIVSEDSDEGSGAVVGIVKRLPKSASLTWWRLQVMLVSTSAVRHRMKTGGTHAAPRMRDRMRSSRAGHGILDTRLLDKIGCKDSLLSSIAPDHPN